MEKAELIKAEVEMERKHREEMTDRYEIRNTVNGRPVGSVG